ncbi:hypothetical protein D3C73_435790 [compost metagenome]
MAHTDINHSKLQNARNQHAPGEIPGDQLGLGTDPQAVDQSGDHHHVQKNGRNCRCEEMMQRIQHAAHHRRQRHAHQIGEHDRRHADGQRHLFGVVGKTRRDDETHQPWHGEFHDNGDEEERRKEHPEDLFRKALGALDTVGLDFFRKQRHEGGVEGAFGKQPAKQVRKTEGGIEDVRHRPCAERCRHRRLTGEAEDAAAERRAADGCEFLDEAHGRISVTRAPCSCAAAVLLWPLPVSGSSSPLLPGRS